MRKDCIIEDAMKEMVIEIGEDDSDSNDEDDEEDMVDDDDRQLIGQVLRNDNDEQYDSKDGQSTSTDICTETRLDTSV